MDLLVGILQFGDYLLFKTLDVVNSIVPQMKEQLLQLDRGNHGALGGHLRNERIIAVYELVGKLTTN
jgi:hypothetical protein